MAIALPKRLFLFSPIERMIAWRYLRPRRKEGFVSVIAAFAFLGIAIGVATLIIVMSVMNGFRQELLSRVLGFNSHVVVYGVGGPLKDYDRIARRIRTIPGVRTATPVVDGQVMATANQKQSGAFVKGMRAEDYKKHPLLTKKLIPDRALTSFETGKIIVGVRMAARLRILVEQNAPPEKVKLLSPKCISTPVGCVPRIRSFDVVGTFEVGMSEYDRGFIFMPLKTAQDFFNMEDGVSNIEVLIKNPDNAELIARAITAKRIPNIRVRTWQEVHSTFFNALKVERNVMFLILMLIIIVAALNIISSMIMLVKDKGQAIAILRTMGATRGTIMRLFFMTGSAIGVFGTLLGVSLGLIVAHNIDAIKRWVDSLFGEVFPSEVYFLSQLPAIVDWSEVGEVVGLALVVTFVATIYPAWRASRLDPVVALRNE